MQVCSRPVEIEETNYGTYYATMSWMPPNKKLWIPLFFFDRVRVVVSLESSYAKCSRARFFFFLSAVKLFLYLELLYFNIASINASNYLERYRDPFLRLGLCFAAQSSRMLC